MENSTATPKIETTFDQVKELNEQFLTAARRAGHLYLDSYEKAVDRTVALELKLAGMTQQEWLRSIIEAQADVTRELASSYATAARGLLK
jgi:hypothetical protein